MIAYSFFSVKCLPNHQLFDFLSHQTLKKNQINQLFQIGVFLHIINWFEIPFLSLSKSFQNFIQSTSSHELIFNNLHLKYIVWFPMRVNRNTGPDMNYQIQLNSIEFVIIKVHLLVEKAIWLSLISRVLVLKYATRLY